MLGLLSLCDARICASSRLEIEPPVVGRPSGFGGAIGSFRITTEATPRALQAEDSLTLTVRITATGPTTSAPTRPALHRVPGLSQRFVIEDLPDGDSHPPTGVWQFRYRLRPRNPAVGEIPAIRFDYFKPGVVPPEKGYRATYSRPIPILVRPRQAVTASEAVGPPAETVPTSMTQVVDDPAAIMQPRKDLPAWLLLLGLFLGPPVAAAGWYTQWRARHGRWPVPPRPIGWQTRKAIRRLRRIRAAPAPGDARVVAVLVTDYLKRKFGSADMRPTPGREAHPPSTDRSRPEFGDKAMGLLRACDEDCYSPDAGARTAALADAAIALIQGMEAGGC